MKLIELIHYKPDPNFYRGKYGFDGKHQIQPRAPHVNPHGGQELTLMLKGLKPAALISLPSEAKKFDKYVKDGILIHKKIKSANPGYTTYLFALPQEAWRLDEIDKLYTWLRKLGDKITNEQLKSFHRRLGSLLGYPAKDIETFVKEC